MILKPSVVIHVIFSISFDGGVERPCGLLPSTKIHLRDHHFLFDVGVGQLDLRRH